jgi:hypothetical protein
MNNWHTELMAEQRREELRKEMEQVRLEEQALAARSSQRARRGWYSRQMSTLANWMIATGRELQCRYELRDCSHDLRDALTRST